MSVTQKVDIARQPLISLSALALSVLHLTVQHNITSSNQCENQCPDVDRMTSNISRRISRDVCESRNEGSEVGNTDLKTTCSGTHIMRRDVVGEPAHDDGRAGEDAGADEEGATVLDERAAGGDEHDIANNR
jgi:hypothetical protein